MRGVGADLLSATPWVRKSQFQDFLLDPSPIIGYSKLVDIVTVAHVGDENRVDNSLVQIWKVKFGHIVKFLFTLITRFQGLVKILKLKFGHYFALLMLGFGYEVQSWLRF